MVRDLLLWVGGLRDHSRRNTWVLCSWGRILLPVFPPDYCLSLFALLDVYLLHWFAAYRVISNRTYK